LHFARAACRAKKSCAAARFHSAAIRPIDRAELARLASAPAGYRISPARANLFDPVQCARLPATAAQSDFHRETAFQRDYQFITGYRLWLSQ
jgi:hypothetical protein